MGHELLTLDETAAYLRLPVATLYRWRSQNPPYGPKGSKVGRHVRYRRADVERWLDAQAAPAPRSAA